jgi:hypothetical protein
VSQLVPGLIVAAVVVVLFSLMGGAWRRRTRRDARIAPEYPAFAGEPQARFARVLYVATTPEGAPLERIAAPGLAFRGFCDIDVFASGVEIRLPGEHPVRIPVSTLIGTGSAQTRIDKVVEAGGLALLRWRSGERTLETSFRFASPAAQLQFTAAVEALSSANPHTSSFDDTTQEA